MADKATVPTIQCSEGTKAQFRAAAETLNWDMQRVAELAGELLTDVVADEESPEQRKARLVSKLSATRARLESHSNPTRVAS